MVVEVQVLFWAPTKRFNEAKRKVGIAGFFYARYLCVAGQCECGCSIFCLLNVMPKKNGLATIRRWTKRCPLFKMNRTEGPGGGMVDALASGVSDLWSWRFKSSPGHQIE